MAEKKVEKTAGKKIFIPKRPQGEITRGKTAPNRLRRVDNFLLLYDPGVISYNGGAYKEAFFVDLGFGRTPDTTIESALRFRRINPDLRVLGVEIDEERVEEARNREDNRTFFRVGGFNLPVDMNREPVRLIRAFNVLRQYKEEAVDEAVSLMGRYVVPGGLLIEGTSDPFGRIWTANLFRKKEQLYREAYIFSVNPKGSFDPTALQPVLTKNLIHRMVPGEKIFDFFEAWKQEYKKKISLGITDSQQLFVSSCRGLKDLGFDVHTEKRWLNRGFLIWRQNSSIL